MEPANGPVGLGLGLAPKSIERQNASKFSTAANVARQSTNEPAEAGASARGPPRAVPSDLIAPKTELLYIAQKQTFRAQQVQLVLHAQALAAQTHAPARPQPALPPDASAGAAGGQQGGQAPPHGFDMAAIQSMMQAHGMPAGMLQGMQAAMPQGIPMMPDPALLQRMLQAQRQRLAQSPVAQQALSNPRFMADMLASNPAARHIMEMNPRLHQLISSPDALKDLMSGDTSKMREVLGNDMGSHMATIANLNSHAQQMRQNRGGMPQTGGSVMPGAEPSANGTAEYHSGQQSGHGDDQHAGVPHSTAAWQQSGSHQHGSLWQNCDPAVNSIPVGSSASIRGSSVHPGNLNSDRQWAGITSEIQPATADGQQGSGNEPQLPISWMPQPPPGADFSIGSDSSNWSQHPPGWQQTQPLLGQSPPGQQEQQQKPLLPHMDMAYPVVYALLVAAICTWRLLPFWALLLLLPPSFLAGMQFIVLKAGGVDARQMPGTRFTMAFVVSLEVATFAAFVLYIVPAMPHLWARSLAAVGLGTAALVYHYRAASTSPGFVPTTADPEAAPAARRYNMGFCDTCRVARPLRSKHCTHCNRCVLGADHHCPVINACVGERNARLFLCYIANLLAAQLLYLGLAVAYARHIVQQPQLGAAAALWRAAGASCGIVLLTYLQVPAVLANAFLVARALLCVAAGLTSNELMRPARFGYLSAADDTFMNPFDQGPAANCLAFWRGDAAPDPAEVYAKHLQVSPADVDSNVPRFSVTALIRAQQTGARRLSELKRQRRRQQEDLILQKYGGVKPETLAADASAPLPGNAAECMTCAYSHGAGSPHLPTVD